MMTTPGQLIAELPGILGFYPTDSVIVFALLREDDTRCTLGPVVRADRGDGDSLAEIGAMLRSTIHPDDCFALVVSPTMTSADVHAVVSAEIPGLRIIWHVEEVTEGEIYSAMWTSGNVQAQAESFLTGEVPPIFAAESTKHVLATGGGIAENRHAALERYRLDPKRRDEGATIVEAAEQHVMRSDTATLIQSLRSALSDDLVDEAQALTVAAMLASPTTRDLAIGELADQQEHTEAVLLPVAQTVADKTLRAGALSMLAAIYMMTERSHLAANAIRAAAETDMKHRLTALMSEALMVGILDQMSYAMREGISIARAQAGIADLSEQV